MRRVSGQKRGAGGTRSKATTTLARGSGGSIGGAAALGPGNNRVLKSKEGAVVGKRGGRGGRGGGRGGNEGGSRFEFSNRASVSGQGGKGGTRLAELARAVDAAEKQRLASSAPVNAISGLVYSPGGEGQVWCASAGGALHVHAAESGEQRVFVPLPARARGRVAAVADVGSETWVAVGGSLLAFKSVPVEGEGGLIPPTIVLAPAGPASMITTIAAAPTNNGSTWSVATGSVSGSVDVWDAQERLPLASWYAGAEAVGQVAMYVREQHAGGGVVVWASIGANLRRWELKKSVGEDTGGMFAPKSSKDGNKPGRITALAVNGASPTLWVGDEYGGVQCLDAESGRSLIAPRRHHTESLTALAVFGELGVSVSIDGKCCVWSAVDGSLLHSLGQSGSVPLWSVALVPSIATGTWTVWVGGDDHTIRIFSLQHLLEGSDDYADESEQTEEVEGRGLAANGEEKSPGDGEDEPAAQAQTEPEELVSDVEAEFDSGPQEALVEMGSMDEEGGPVGVTVDGSHLARASMERAVESPRPRPQAPDPALMESVPSLLNHSMKTTRSARSASTSKSHMSIASKSVNRSTTSRSGDTPIRPAELMRALREARAREAALEGALNAERAARRKSDRAAAKARKEATERAGAAAAAVEEAAIAVAAAAEREAAAEELAGGTQSAATAAREAAVEEVKMLRNALAEESTARRRAEKEASQAGAIAGEAKAEGASRIRGLRARLEDVMEERNKLADTVRDMEATMQRVTHEVEAAAKEAQDRWQAQLDGMEEAVEKAHARADLAERARDAAQVAAEAATSEAEAAGEELGRLKEEVLRLQTMMNEVMGESLEDEESVNQARASEREAKEEARKMREMWKESEEGLAQLAGELVAAERRAANAEAALEELKTAPSDVVNAEVKQDADGAASEELKQLAEGLAAAVDRAERAEAEADALKEELKERVVLPEAAPVQQDTSVKSSTDQDAVVAEEIAELKAGREEDSKRIRQLSWLLSRQMALTETADRLTDALVAQLSAARVAAAPLPDPEILEASGTSAAEEADAVIEAATSPTPRSVSGVRKSYVSISLPPATSALELSDTSAYAIESFEDEQPTPGGNKQLDVLSPQSSQVLSARSARSGATGTSVGSEAHLQQLQALAGRLQGQLEVLQQMRDAANESVVAGDEQEESGPHRDGGAGEEGEEEEEEEFGSVEEA